MRQATGQRDGLPDGALGGFGDAVVFAADAVPYAGLAEVQAEGAYLRAFTVSPAHRSVDALVAGRQAHAGGGAVRHFPVGAAVAVGIVVVLAAGAGDIGRLGGFRVRQHHGSGGAVPRHLKAQRLRQSAGGDIVRSGEHKGLHGVAFGVPQIQHLTVQRYLDITILNFLLYLAAGGACRADQTHNQQ